MGARDIPISPATSESSPLKMMSQSENSDDLHSRTTRSPTAPMGAACFHLTASRYFLPAEREDAPMATSLRVGCSLRRRIKRWPTEPVQPRTPGACIHQHWSWMRVAVSWGRVVRSHDANHGGDGGVMASRRTARLDGGFAHCVVDGDSRSTERTNRGSRGTMMVVDVVKCCGMDSLQ